MTGNHLQVPYVSLPINVRSVAAARGLLHDTLHRHRTEASPTSDSVPAVAADAVLMLSELVTNAVRHARALLLLEISIRGTTLHVAVIDDAPRLSLPVHEERKETGGRGLTIVDALADRWGSTPGPGSKSVWFEISLP
ncbi:MAG TPA: ATP-binding protein [Kineosporiaceae bacterium]